MKNILGITQLGLIFIFVFVIGGFLIAILTPPKKLCSWAIRSFSARFPGITKKISEFGIGICMQLILFLQSISVLPAGLWGKTKQE